MYRQLIFLISLTTIFCLTVLPGLAQTEPSEPWTVEVLEADGQHALLELNLTDYTLEPITLNGTQYQRLSVDGWGYWGQPGQPQLPMYGVSLGIPSQEKPQVTVVEIESELIDTPLLAPVSDYTLNEDTEELIPVFTRDESIYNSNAFYPDSAIESGNVNLMRGQPIFQLRLYPFQYNPQQQTLKIHRRIKLLVQFPGGLNTASESGSVNPAFEEVFKGTILNYETMPRVSLPGSTPTLFPASETNRVKMILKEQGMYEISYEDMTASGVPTSFLNTDPANIKITNQGQEVAIYFLGDGDNSFESGESFVFYGDSINTWHTEENVYWLEVGSSGARMSSRDVSSLSGSTPSTFTQVDLIEEDKKYWGGATDDNWFWDRLKSPDGYPDSLSDNFTLDNVASVGNSVQIRMEIQSKTYYDFELQLKLNGNSLSTQSWPGDSEWIYEDSISQNKLNQGSNDLVVTSEHTGSSGKTTQIYISWLELTYQSDYKAINNRLAFPIPSGGPYTIEISDFTSDQLNLFDITNATSPILLTNPVIEANADKYHLKFTDSAANPDKQYMAYATSAFLDPLQIEYIPPTSALRSPPSGGATYLVIINPEFSDSIQDLVDHRTAQGESVLVVETDDIYNEFNEGIFGPEAIRDFLTYAYANWSIKPVYLVLVGDGSIDPKNHLGSSSLPDLIPSNYEMTPSLGKVPIDNWYTKLDGPNDELSDIFLGRLPVQSDSELATIIDKIKGYELTALSGDWYRKALLIGDEYDDVLKTTRFKEDMDMIADMLPKNTITSITNIHDFSSLDVPQDVGDGVLLLAYSGHGGIEYWWADSGLKDFFGLGKDQDIADMSNSGYRLPFLVSANCRNGYFTYYEETPQALAEDFILVPDKGGIAVFAPSSYGFDVVDTLIFQNLYSSLFDDDQLIIGQATTAARIDAYNQSAGIMLVLFDAFTLFGDPALKLNAKESPLKVTSSGPALLGDPITLTAEVTDINNVTYTWDMGDGTAPFEHSSPLQYTYSSVGDYTVAITATIGTTTLVTTIDVHVSNEAIAGLTATNNSPNTLGKTTTLTANVTAGNGIKYMWDFGDGSDPVEGDAVITHSYPAAGTYTAQVTASNAQNSMNTSTAVTIQQPELLKLTSSGPTTPGNPMTLTAQVSGTDLGEITYTWDMGDGTPAFKGDSQVQHSYTTAGDYTVTVTVTFGSTTLTKTLEVHVSSEPVAGLTVTNDSPTILGQATTLSASVTSGNGIEYTWDFGTGTAPIKSGPTVQFIYPSAGTYTATVTATSALNSLQATTPVIILIDDSASDEGGIYLPLILR